MRHIALCVSLMAMKSESKVWTLGMGYSERVKTKAFIIWVSFLLNKAVGMLYFGNKYP